MFCQEKWHLSFIFINMIFLPKRILNNYFLFKVYFYIFILLIILGFVFAQSEALKDFLLFHRWVANLGEKFKILHIYFLEKSTESKISKQEFAFNTIFIIVFGYTDHVNKFTLLNHENHPLMRPGKLIFILY